MKHYGKSKPLISIHIPKSAGTSFMRVLETWYGRRLYKHYFDPKKNRMPKKRHLWKGLIRKRSRAGICMHGHFNRERHFALEQSYPEANDFITIVRDPFEVHISYFFYLQTLRYEVPQARAPHPIVMDDNYNICKHLNDTRSFMLLHLPKDLTMDNYKDVLDTRFVYLGLAEDLQTSVDVLAQRLGFKSVSVEHANTTLRSEQIPDGAREMFVKNHPLEFAIYSYAKAHYKDNH